MPLVTPLILDLLPSSRVSVWKPRTGGNVFSHYRGGFGCVEEDFPPSLLLDGFKVKIGRPGIASQRPGFIRAACSCWQIWLCFPRESCFPPAVEASPAQGRTPRGCSGPGRSGFGACSPAAWPGQEMRPLRISTHSSQTESE